MRLLLQNASTRVQHSISNARQRAALLACAGILLADPGTSALAQSALDGFDPNANGTIRVVVVQPDGKILIGGEFTAVAPNGGATVTRNRIARLNPDGTLDMAFDPNADGNVYGIALQADGKILAVGAFHAIGGQARNHIARLDPTTGLADKFNPAPDTTIFAVAVQSDGKILVGGGFESIGGQARNYIARLDPTTGLADSFDPNADFFVYSIALRSNGKVVVGGGFSAIGGEPRNRVAQLDPTTGLADSFDPNANDSVFCVAVQADGKILAGGNFISIGGQPRNRIARLGGNSGSADSFDPNASSTVSAIAIQPDGKILAGGGFTSIGGQTRSRLARLDAVTGSADSFDPNVDGFVHTIAIDATGKILAGGNFNTLVPLGGAAVTRNHIARLETDSRVDQTFDPGANGQIITMVTQPDGKIVVGGWFTTIGGGGSGSTPRNYIARLNSDGTVDPSFSPGASDLVITLALQPDGKILVGGFFSRLGGGGSGTFTRRRIGRLNADGTLDASFDPGANDLVNALVLQPDGKILAGGDFTTLGGGGTGTVARQRVGRLHPDGTIDKSFNPGANDGVHTIALQADSKILVGGRFTALGGGGATPRSRLGRLEADGTLDPTFDPGVNGEVYAIAVQANNQILVGGLFSMIGGGGTGTSQVYRIARLQSDGVVDSTFTPWVDNWVSALAVQADGKIMIGGYFCQTADSVAGPFITRVALACLNPDGTFDSFNPGLTGCGARFINTLLLSPDGKLVVGANGQMFLGGGVVRNRIARLTNTGAASQQLNVLNKGVDIFWQRGGTAPEIDRAVFEFSSDGLNYTPLPEPLRVQGGWQLAGQSLPAGPSFVRARGYHSNAGFSNLSGSIIETVRSLFIVGPLQLDTAVSRKMHGSAGDFDIALPLKGEPGVECRASAGAHTLRFTFNNGVVSGTAIISSGKGSVAGSSTFSGNTMTVNLTGVTDVQKITVTLNNVTDSFDQVLPETSVSMNVLAGDVNGNKTVNATDVGQTKSNSGAPVTAANFRQDVAVSGTINASDIGLVKSRSGQSVP